MALLKKIELENGITLNYHRVVSLNKIINQYNVIEVASYTSSEKRDEEKKAIEEGLSKKEAVSMNVFINSNYIEKEYNETETIQEIYNYLKTTDKFKDAENI